MSVVNGAVTIHTPDDGAIGLADRAAAHGCAWHDFGPTAATNIRVGFWWSGVRPAEASPLLHVDMTKPEGGMGMWAIADSLPATPGDQPVWFLGSIGNNNANFGAGGSNVVRSLTAAEVTRFSGGQRAYIEITSIANILRVYVNGTDLGMSVAVPANLIGSGRHGFAIDNNQCWVTPGDSVAPFPRTPDWPAGYGPFTIGKA